MSDNTLFTAQNLGSLTSTTSVSGLVGDTDFNDFYRFELTNTSNLNIVLKGDADLRLIRDFDGDGVVDANEVIASSGTTGTGTPGTVFESINLFNQASGTYFVRVTRFSTSDTNYQLSLSRDSISNLIAQEAGAELGNLSTTPITRFGFVGSSDTSDFYRFNLASTSDINISLTELSADADIRLIRDFDGDGVVDASEVIASSTFGSSVSEAINVNNQAAGNYFVQVYAFGIVNANNTNYTLRLSNASTNNLIAPEANLGTLSAPPATYFGSVGDTDTSEIVRFNLASVSDLNISLTGLSADADLQLIRDINNNGVVEGGEVISSSTRSGNVDDSINLSNQAAGNYFVQVYQFGGNTNYTLRLSNADISNLIASEANLGNLSATPATFSSSVGNTDTSDVVRFSLASTSDLNISVTGLSADADVRLFRDTNNNGVFDLGENITTVTRSGNLDESINLNNQAAGTYFVQVYQFGSNNTNYTLRLSNEQPSNLIAVQENFGLLTAGGNGITRTDFVGNSDTSDIYRFSLNSTCNLTASLNGITTLVADADLRLFRDSNQNGIVELGEEITRSSGGVTQELINQVLSAGDYFLQAYQFSGETNYSLTVNAV
ncbi:PPC domain-containing protein [Chroococcus sp. FPU101]|uniref:PPC domain-containing protein n=1 Tax=Chroococcus sp. FPU101 TaxID=1974212 RepID=UPI001A8CB842|nr:PPC domain-containing protein [Chroococcus sp. FPU101]GFE71990.1 hypothetical protein CFPU101_46000 [Chroococcus sp. FPU101]